MLSRKTFVTPNMYNSKRRDFQGRTAICTMTISTSSTCFLIVCLQTLHHEECINQVYDCLVIKWDVKWLCCRDISCTRVNPQHFQCLYQFEMQVLLFLKEEVQHVDRLTWWLLSPTIHNISYQDDFKVDNTSMDLLNRSHTEVLSS